MRVLDDPNDVPGRIGDRGDADSAADFSDSLARAGAVVEQPAPGRRHYASLYDHHLRDQLGHVPLRELTSGQIARWQAERLATGAGPVAVQQALKLLGAILEHAHRDERIPTNPQRRVHKARQPRREEIRPIAPAAIEAMRAAVPQRDATLISVVAYAGLRPGEALALTWDDVRDRTLLVQRALSLGEISDTKTGQHRTVRLLRPLAADLLEWQIASGQPPKDQLIFPSQEGTPWTQSAYKSWRRRTFARAVKAAGLTRARPYDLRHSFASLLLHEGRSVIYVARQLGHDARLTLSHYGHVIDELDDEPRLGAEAAILAAREAPGTRSVPAQADETPTAGSSRTSTSMISRHFDGWAVRGSNPRPPACKAGALTS